MRLLQQGRELGTHTPAKLPALSIPQVRHGIWRHRTFTHSFASSAAQADGGEERENSSASSSSSSSSSSDSDLDDALQASAEPVQRGPHPFHEQLTVLTPLIPGHVPGAGLTSMRWVGEVRSINLMERGIEGLTVIVTRTAQVWLETT